MADFQQIFTEFCWNFCKFHGISSQFRMFMNFWGCRDKTRIETRIETQRRPVVLPLRGAEVLVAVRGPSPGEGGREKCEPGAWAHKELNSCNCEQQQATRSREGRPVAMVLHIDEIVPSNHPRNLKIPSNLNWRGPANCSDENDNLRSAHIH